MTVSYAVLSAAIIGVFGYFANTTIERWLHIDVPVWILMFGAIVVDLLFAWFDIKITARILGVFFVAEVLGALILAVAILAVGGANGLTAAPLNPVKLFNNHVGDLGVRRRRTGDRAVRRVLVLGRLRDGAQLRRGDHASRNTSSAARRTARCSCSASSTSWSPTRSSVGWGTNHVAQAVNAQFKGETISAFYPLTARYAGVSLTDAFKVLIITSSFACQLAFFNTASRYLFALGRERLLPSALGRTHGKHKTPHVAAVVLAIAMFIYVGGFVHLGLVDRGRADQARDVVAAARRVRDPRASRRSSRSRSCATSGRSTGPTSTLGRR